RWRHRNPMDDMVLAAIAQGWIWYVRFLPWTAGSVLIWVAAGRTLFGSMRIGLGRTLFGMPLLLMLAAARNCSTGLLDLLAASLGSAPLKLCLLLHENGPGLLGRWIGQLMVRGHWICDGDLLDGGNGGRRRTGVCSWSPLSAEIGGGGDVGQMELSQAVMGSVATAAK
ncbi:hypothetical protein ACLOJK_006697, partial [Asimina triloba]